MNDPILYRVERGVSIVTLNRPEVHNALDDAASQLLAETIERAIGDPDSRAIVLRGEGKSFCSGRDVRVLGKRVTGLSHFEHLTRSQARKFRLIESRKPTIAVLRGHAIGGGFEMALHCDMRVAATDARLSLPEIRHGLLVDGGGSSITTILAGPSRAKFMLMTGRPIGAEQALAWGLADFIGAPDEVDDIALDIAAEIAEQPPVHLSAVKYLVDGVHGERVKRVMHDELMAQNGIYLTADYAEAKTARQEQRKPRYTGR